METWNATIAAAMETLLHSTPVTCVPAFDPMVTAQALLQVLYGCTDAFLALSMTAGPNTYMTRTMDPAKYVWPYLARNWVCPGVLSTAPTPAHLVQPVYALCGQDPGYVAAILDADKDKLARAFGVAAPSPKPRPGMPVPVKFNEKTRCWEVCAGGAAGASSVSCGFHVAVTAAYAFLRQALASNGIESFFGDEDEDGDKDGDGDEGGVSGSLLMQSVLRKYHEAAHTNAKAATTKAMAAAFVGHFLEPSGAGGDYANPFVLALLNLRCGAGLTADQKKAIAVAFDSVCRDVASCTPPAVCMKAFVGKVLADRQLGQRVLDVLKAAGFFVLE
jgi:hypothetical protein